MLIKHKNIDISQEYVYDINILQGHIDEIELYKYVFILER